MSFFSKLFGGTSGYQTEEEAAANIARQQEEIRATNNRRFESGEIDEEKFGRYENFVNNAGNAESVEGAFNSGFGEGLTEGRNNIDGAIFGTLGKVFQSVPWFIWAGFALAIFGWLGGFAMLAKKSKGVLKR